MPLRTSTPFRVALIALAAALPRAAALAQADGSSMSTDGTVTRTDEHGCTATISRTSLGTMAGERISSVRIVTLAPAPFPVLAAVVDRLHIRTQTSTVERQLLFDSGEVIDTLRVAESLRRLRGQRYLADAWVEGRRCGDSAGVALTVTTRDAWSTKAEVKVKSSSTTLIGLDERNLLGTGRQAGVYVRSDEGRIGIGFQLRDPWVDGSNLSASIQHDGYRDGHSWYGSLGTRERSVFDRWRVELAVASATRGNIGDSADVFRRDGAVFLLSRRVLASTRGATSLLFGLEGERTMLSAAPDAPIVGPSTVRRRLAAADVGLRRESASYDTLTWLLMRQAIVDVPEGVQTEAVAGVGEDFDTHRALLHLDAWAGQMWRPTRRSLLVADAWANGYLGDDRWDAALLRAQLSLYRAARRGVWTAQLAGERLFDPDPDVRTLATTDLTVGAIPERSRLARTSIAAAVERSAPLFAVSRSWAVDAALFGAGSSRWNPVRPSPTPLSVGVIGAGLRVVPLKPGRATSRVDIGYPVLRGAGVRQRPFIAVTFSPWLGAIHARDGRQDQ